MWYFLKVCICNRFLNFEKISIQDALIDNMPETVLTVFQTYIESANKGLANWIFKHRGAKLLHTLSLPATLPADLICATLTK